ncbi:TDP-N-acetylfucosamine:lipid II N-acetylfucosaminyltransferase [Bizionia sediminis]|uniref:TDP-N-acetylfucosamine:lipid II N-acetylfucosaminyltransferase n=1 Tax=Bizionia sediminis TaxID=1737064 RepID=A0ABW5KVE5_9FLAO
MLLHFVIDEKVTDQIIENFSKVDKTSRFLVFVENKNEPYQYITSRAGSLIKFNEASNNINNLVQELQVTAILMHACHLEYARVINALTVNLKIAWYPWGFDIYGLPRIKPQTYAYFTNKYLINTVKNLRLGRLILKNRCTRDLYFKIDTREKDRYTTIFKALKKVDYFVSYLQEDFECFSKYYPNKFQFIYSPFSTLNQYLGGNEHLTLQTDATHILIGNSNSIESNHVDVFSFLAKQQLHNNIKLYTPLSYGDNPKYKAYVLKEGKAHFKDNFVPLLDFMPRQDYLKILASCSTGIFYHYRQQAMGNIIAMLYLGCRVYLSEKNPAFNFFRTKNITIFNLETDFPKFKNTKLEAAVVTENRQQLRAIFSENAVLQNINMLIKTIM